MTASEVQDMQRRIDEGIRLAQQRLVKRAIHNNISLVVFRNGKVIDLTPEEMQAQNIK